MTGLFVLGKFGIPTASFAVVIGSAGLAIGLAFSGTLSNFASGMMLLIFRPYKIGDVVNVAGQTGKIDELELFTTTMDTPDNRRIIVPNSALFGAVIENITAP
ncbi:MAG: mechanosensitive ion channel [Phycisphaeraceae bacterium]|nr:mechanosensitive ion channel [Phycisphaeraceae bacterium]